VAVDDIVKTSNHFVAFDYLLNMLDRPFSSELIMEFHRILKTGASDAIKVWFRAGDRKNRLMKWAVCKQHCLRMLKPK
jgi:hypothetical protein